MPRHNLKCFYKKPREGSSSAKFLALIVFSGQQIHLEFQQIIVHFD